MVLVLAGAVALVSTPPFLAWPVVAGMVVVTAGLRAVRGPTATPGRSAPASEPAVADVVLERRAVGTPPILWLKIAAGPKDHLMRVLVTEIDVTIETDLTNPPSIRRYEMLTPVGALANRLLWSATTNGPHAQAARAIANQLLTLLAAEDARSGHQLPLD